jgi:hypothetical protein
LLNALLPALFLNLAYAIQEGMSSKSKASTKGALLDGCIATMQEKAFYFRDENHSKEILKNMIKISLQSEGSSLLWFKTTTSSDVLCTHLLKPVYQYIVKSICGTTSDKPVNDADLKAFVLDKEASMLDKEDYCLFNSANKEENYSNISFK